MQASTFWYTLRGGAPIAVILKVRALLQQRGQVPRLEFQRLLIASISSVAATERLEAAGQVRPQGRVLGIGGGGAREHRLRLLRRAAIEHAHAQFVEYRGVVRGPLRDAGQDLIRFRHASGGRLGSGHLHRSGDGGLVERHGGSSIQGLFLSVWIHRRARNCTLARCRQSGSSYYRINPTLPKAPGMAADLELMRASALLESNPAAAARSASAILKGFPGHAEAQLLLATACQRMGDPAAARSQLESLVQAQPASPTLQLELGRALAAGGHTAEALGALQAAVTLDPRLADAWRELAAQRFVAGEILGGDSAYAEYTRLIPRPPELNDATEAVLNRRLDTAEGLLRRRLQQSPDHVAALYMLAEIAGTRGSYLELERLLNQVLKLAPGHAEARFDLANELVRSSAPRKRCRWSNGCWRRIPPMPATWR